MEIITEIIEQKIKALAQHLEIEKEPQTIEELAASDNPITQSNYDDCSFEHNTIAGEWLVLTNEEADTKTYEDIENSLWAFRAGFIIDQAGIKYDALNFHDLEKALEQMQSSLCEDASLIIRVMIEDSDGTIDGFVEEAISEDGRGHFLNRYDGEEHPVTIDDVVYYIYQTD